MLVLRHGCAKKCPDRRSELEKLAQKDLLFFQGKRAQCRKIRCEVSAAK